MIDHTTTEWSLRDEILASSHRWPLILAFCLAGALLGLVAALVWPSPHRAENEIYVAINAYRALQDRNVATQFNYIDDYKNWQMSNLNVIVQSKEIVGATLDQLRTEDPYWNDVNREELASMLHVYWRNAGKWRLVAESPSSNRAIQAANAWQAVVLDRVQSYIGHAQDTFVIDTQLQALSATQAQAQARLAQLTQLTQDWQGWRQAAGQSIDENQRQRLLASLQAANLGAAWQDLQVQFPASGASLQEYFSWLDQAGPRLESEIRGLNAQVQGLEPQRADLAQRYEQAAQKSKGFSANLEIEKVTDAPPQVMVIRPTGVMVLIGAILGLFAWVVLWLSRLVFQARK